MHDGLHAYILHIIIVIYIIKNVLQTRPDICYGNTYTRSALWSKIEISINNNKLTRK